ncbi:hypothetical protein L1887_55781 [Cichorium endivia]|nr:hypothetical protein L1887_55781 [Cichorium endivia]
MCRVQVQPIPLRPDLLKSHFFLALWHTLRPLPRLGRSERRPVIYASDATRPSLLPHTITLTKGTQGPSLDSSRSPQLKIFRLYLAIAKCGARGTESRACNAVRCPRGEGQKSKRIGKVHVSEAEARASVTRHVAPRTAHRDQHLEAPSLGRLSRAQCVWEERLGAGPTSDEACSS